ncbi:MAG TPA: substrate-binding domain-containing protein [Candidatus Limnocylindrales bacterium]|nr:substrate-binding domain-containing protein [Candidatus Limnocylindrales bacterium]
MPQELKVIGAGNVHYSDLLRVPLSTVDQSSTQIGQQAADILLKAIGSKRKKAPVTLVTEPRLIVRESTSAQ